MIIKYENFGNDGIINLPIGAFWKLFVQETTESDGKEYYDCNIMLSCGTNTISVLYLEYLIDDYDIPRYEIASFANAIINEFVQMLIENTPLIDMNTLFETVLEKDGFRSKWIEKNYVSGSDI